MKIMCGINEPVCLINLKDQKEATLWLDCMLDAVANFSLMSKLNEIQCETGEGVFPSKFEIPLVIVNLVLKEFNLCLVEESK